MSCSIINPADNNVCYGFSDKNIDNIISYWDTNDCVQSLISSLNNNDSSSGEPSLLYNQNSLITAQQDVNNLFSLYSQTYEITEDKNSNKYNSFQNTLLDLCRNKSLPGVCDILLSSTCPNYTRDEISNSELLNDYCGCYAPNNPYTQYGPQCDPLCSIPSVIQKADPKTGKFISCLPNVCIIDDVTLQTRNSRIDANLNLINICTGCGSDGCLCILSSPDITGLISDLGINETINQFCGPNSQCIVKDSDGNIISNQPCNTINASKPKFKSNLIPWVWIIIAVSFILILLFIYFIF
jgi:hypothetical protein